MPIGSNYTGILGFQFYKIFKNRLFKGRYLLDSKKFNLVFLEVPPSFAYLKVKGIFNQTERLFSFMGGSGSKRKTVDIKVKCFSCCFFLFYFHTFFLSFKEIEEIGIEKILC